MATDNDVKLSHALKTISAYAFLICFAGHVTINCQVAVGVLFTYQFWNVIWIRILTNTEQLYKVKVPTTIIPGWVPLSVPSGKDLKIQKNKPVTSISELSGIRGTHMMVALRVMTAVINSLLIVAIQAHLHHNKSTLFSSLMSGDYVPICFFIWVAGFFFVGHFELNLMDGTHTKYHYLGVAFIFIGSLACGFVFHWNLYSSVMTVLHFGMAIYWTNYCESCKKLSDDIKEITHISKMCVGIELAMFQVTNVMLVTTIYASGLNEGKFFTSPFLNY